MSYIQYWLEHGLLPDPENGNRYLYYNGAEYESITGGWSGAISGSAAVSKQTDHILLKATNGNSYTYLTSINKVSLNGYSKLVLVRSKTSNSTNFLTIKLDSTSIYKSAIANNIAKSAVEFDISSYDGSYAILFELATGGAMGDGSIYDFRIYEIYLKK